MSALVSAIERASESDRLWFEKQSERDVRIRPLVSGEFGSLGEPEASLMLVLQVAPGVRARCAPPLLEGPA